MKDNMLLISFCVASKSKRIWRETNKQTEREISTKELKAQEKTNNIQSNFFSSKHRKTHEEWTWKKKKSFDKNVVFTSN